MTNILYLSDDPDEAVQWLMDVDIIRMPIEIAQVLSTVTKAKTTIAFAEGDVWSEWAVGNKSNYEELWNYGMDLLDEHYHRFGSRSVNKYKHGIAGLLERLSTIPSHIPDGEMSDKPWTVEQSRLMYTQRGSFSTYTHRTVPQWKLAS